MMPVIIQVCLLSHLTWFLVFRCIFSCRGEILLECWSCVIVWSMGSRTGGNLLLSLVVMCHGEIKSVGCWSPRNLSWLIVVCNLDTFLTSPWNHVIFDCISLVLIYFSLLFNFCFVWFLVVRTCDLIDVCTQHSIFICNFIHFLPVNL